MFLGHVTIADDSVDIGSFLTDDSLDYFELSHLFVTSNALSIEEETIENPLGVSLYQFEPEFDSDGPENHIGWRVNAVTCEVH